MSTPLLKCPFCGQRAWAHALDQDDPKGPWEAGCMQTCYAQGDCPVRPTVIGSTEEEAARKWNSRYKQCS